MQLPHGYKLSHDCKPDQHVDEKQHSYFEFHYRPFFNSSRWK